MSDLISRLLTAIEEAEEDARDASTWGDDWSVADHVAPPWGEDTPDDVILAAGKPVATMNTEYGGCLAASHVARNDPAAVLRRCAADKRVLERHNKPEPMDPFQVRVWRFEVKCGHCSWTCYTDCEDMVKFPCPDLVDLADRYGISVEEETAGAT